MCYTLSCRAVEQDAATDMKRMKPLIFCFCGMPNALALGSSSGALATVEATTDFELLKLKPYLTDILYCFILFMEISGRVERKLNNV